MTEPEKTATFSRLINENHPQSAQRWRIQVRGVVQGIGFRPFVYRLAHRYALHGWVSNAADGVTLEVEGPLARLDAFWRELCFHPPAGVVYEKIERETIPPVGAAETRFEIVPSRSEGRREPNIPPDLAICAECLRELHDPRDRRFRYPFINCTHCGPRWSIIEGVPYDRPLTSMKGFALCPDCEKEYHDPTDRRFHAQPVACPRCGPQVELRSSSGELVAEGDAAICQTAEAIKRGLIVALKGLGGVQLVCDATREEVVARLRERKRRPDKPFAVMLSREMIEELCELPGPASACWLWSPAAPIFLLPRRNTSPHSGSKLRWTICESVAPGNPYLGVMLPYTPLHHLIVEAVNRPIVCTSGNLSEEPMAIDNEEALARLNAIADLFLLHNRPIVRPVDDSVLAEGASGDVFVIRRARGFAPRPVRLVQEVPVILATGGHLKNAVALSVHDQVILSGHVGDLDNRLAWEAHCRAIEDLLRFFQVVPEAVTCDCHPDYASTRSAEEFSRRLKVPLFRWQHHVAHFAACLAEWEKPGGDTMFHSVGRSSGMFSEDQESGDGGREDSLSGPVMGVIWDGTGYGLDGTVWGGEFFLYDGRGFYRVAHFRPFPLPGGEVVVRQPRRALFGLLLEAGLIGQELQPGGVLEGMFTSSEARVLLRAAGRGVQTPRTSSVGRLFDAVAALLGQGGKISFEGQAAMALQFLAEKAAGSKLCGKISERTQKPVCREAVPVNVATTLGISRLAVEGDGPWIVNWQPLVASLLEARREGVAAELLALAFHERLMEVVWQIAERAGVGCVMFSGGCFQNQLLRRLAIEEGNRRGLTTRLAQAIPPGDGGIALGQLWLTARTLMGHLREGYGGLTDCPKGLLTPS